jgi:hypothetical protein
MFVIAERKAHEFHSMQTVKIGTLSGNADVALEELNNKR